MTPEAGAEKWVQVFKSMNADVARKRDNGPIAKSLHDWLTLQRHWALQAKAA
jgi:hypothetical protein